MRILIRLIVIALLLLNGLTATYGGLSLMLRPDGSILALPTDLLAGTPFRSYFIPGLLLFISNGVSSLCIIGLFISGSPYSKALIKAQGILLIAYIAVQVLLIEVVVPLHLLCGGAGLLLVFLGWLYRPASGPKSKAQRNSTY